MRQDVNLYGPQLLGQATRVSAAHIVLAFLAVALVLGAFGGWQEWRLDQARADAESLGAELARLNAEVERRAAALAAREPSDALLRQVERLERERSGKRALLGRLEGGDMGNLRGFSAHLEGLGRQHPEGLWLQHVYLADGGRRLGLAGGVTEAELVPRYLSALSGEPAFAGTQFDSFSLQRPETASGHLTFILATPCYDEQGRRLSSADCLPESWAGGRP
ncbi:MSHA biogenesis protein MshI [Thioalkalivibrio denitrificans]|uniref:MSHA biogenesis protein MshI n=1 Tax=Thioalkalivibrio denitrificans TaxID=108003 RepID=A0A1V3NPI0_9GAMM|nr:MSHA biogenesis protein MshI [Thioalkalivibrio denitrificans]OOG26778.1 MSHA biogenesis protein MshI [Thioalkalivibrio denitrificans]